MSFTGVEPKGRMIRVKRVTATTLDQLEETMNAALAELEDAGQEVVSVQFFPPESAARGCDAFIVYNDKVGIREAWGQRHEAARLEQERQFAEQARQRKERRTSGDAESQE